MARAPHGDLEAALGARVTGRAALGGGSVGRSEKLTLDDGRTVFVKHERGAPPDRFSEEARGLRALAVPDGPPVPDVLFVDTEHLVLEWFPPGRVDTAGWERFGRALAAMHRHTSPRHGFEHDGYCGLTRQENTWEDDGVTFFAEHRIGFQVRLAAERGLLDRAAVRRAEALMKKLPELLPEGEPASLLHGDLWNGNVLPRADGVACLIDPAAHYGLREAELAMTRLFGALPRAFYAAYESEWPLADGAGRRVDLFNLYHLLNHLNLFGGGYRAGVLRTLEAYT